MDKFLIPLNYDSRTIYVPVKLDEDSRVLCPMCHRPIRSQLEIEKKDTIWATGFDSYD